MNYPTHIVAVAGLITNAAQEILLIKSPKRGWEFPGGQVETGESLVDALQREILEESGIQAEIGALVGVYSNITLPSKVMFDFLGKAIGGDLTTSAESSEVEWVARSQVLERISSPAIYDRMRDMLEFDGQVVYRVYQNPPYEVIGERFLTT